VLIRELAQGSDNPFDACNNPSQTPLLHSITSVHSLIYLLITLGKINQNDVRTLTINKWGGDLGVHVLKALSKLYQNLIWESSMLLWLCNEEQTQQQLHQLIQLQHLQQKQDGTSNSGVSLNGQYLQQLIQQLTNSAGNNLAGSTASSTSFEFNKQDLEKIKSYLVSTLNIPPVVQQPAVSIVQTAQQSVTGDSVTIEKMDTASLATGNVGTGSAPETSNSGPDAGAQTQQSSSTPQQTQAPWVIIA
jgi:hypothetical protein